jgi:RNA polymerase sigma-70 factor (TIGR02960 family)
MAEQMLAQQRNQPVNRAQGRRSARRACPAAGFLAPHRARLLALGLPGVWQGGEVVIPGGRRPAAAESDLDAARRGDGEAFARLTEPLLDGLRGHCYRMLGTLDAADDALQDTLLRAWRGLPGYEPRRPLRAWLFRIATNVCLTALRARSGKGSELLAGGQWESFENGALLLDPYPDRPLGDPQRSAEIGEDIELAFLVALQVLPPRQRAVLLLRDVLDFSVGEVAELLDTTVAAVNSALQRARTTCAAERHAGRVARSHTRGPAGDEAALVRRFAVAWRAGDRAGLARLLAQDALFTMPPVPVPIAGRDAVIAFLLTVPDPDHPGHFRMDLSRANGQPALVLHEPDRTEADLPHAVLVFAMKGDAITSITRFGGEGLAGRFGPAATASAYLFSAADR